MPRSLSCDEYDLLSFFETEPDRLDTGIPWIYDDSEYEVRRGGANLSFRINPSSGDIRIILKNGAVRLFELNALDVADVRFHRTRGAESLEVVISPHVSIWLHTKPTISIIQRCAGHSV